MSLELNLGAIVGSLIVAAIVGIVAWVKMQRPEVAFTFFAMLVSIIALWVGFVAWQDVHFEHGGLEAIPSDHCDIPLVAHSSPMILIVTAEASAFIDKPGTEFAELTMAATLDEQTIAVTQTHFFDPTRGYLSQYNFTTTATGSIMIKKGMAGTLHVKTSTNVPALLRRSFRVHYILLPAR